MSEPAAAELSAELAAATEHQPAARAALAGALRAPSHAYLFAGPHGAGKRFAARAFAAELLAAGAPDAESARRRALAEPSPHPDLVWLAPHGTQHLVAGVREQVIAAAAYRPFEGERRVFVIEEAEAMAAESQNALLKTLEEPAPFVTILLLTAEPEALLETVRSRCQPIRFASAPPEVVEEALAERDPAGDPEARRAVARLAGGDLERAAFLLGEGGRELRAAAERFARGARSGDLEESRFRDLLAAAEAEGTLAASETRARLEAEAEEAAGLRPRRGGREAEEAARRAGRRARTAILDLGLGLVGAWFRDVAAVGEGATGLVLASDRLRELAADAKGLDPRRARVAAELVAETRRRLSVNVGEELALQSLLYRLEAVLGNA